MRLQRSLNLTAVDVYGKWSYDLILLVCWSNLDAEYSESAALFLLWTFVDTSYCLWNFVLRLVRYFDSTV